MTERQTPHLRRLLEIGLWVGVVALFWTLDTLTKLDNLGRIGATVDRFRLVANQATSAVAVLLMILFVAWWLRQFPLDRSRPPLTVLLGHLVGSGLFAIGHYALMVSFRRVVYGLRGLAYMQGQNHLPNLVYEYKKDIKIYLAVVAIIAAYHYVRGRGERADESPEGSADRPLEPAREGRVPKLAVQTARGELLLDIDQIDYLEAARNYVAVHAGGAEYLVRSPLADLAERLPVELFVRAHRSFLVNVDAVEQIRSDDGTATLILRGGGRVPVSRGQRDAVKRRLDRLRL